MDRDSLVSLLAQGLSVERTGKRFGKHPSTVVMACPAHGESEFSIEGRGYYRCKRCRSEAVTNRRR